MIRSRSVISGYWQNLEETERTIRNGWFHTGDLGYLDEQRYLFVVDRLKDMVVSGGVNIYPAEIEAVLINCPGVHDCAVFGIPDEEFGESLAAAIEPIPGSDLDETEVKAYLRAHLANFKVPRLIELHPSLPREDTGKIFKRKLRDPHWEKAGRQI